MSLDDKINKMVTKLIQQEPKRSHRKIQIYSVGVKRKVKNAEYALDKINNLSPGTENITSTEPEQFSIDDKIHLYVDSFFAFLYSAFDVMSHVVNIKYQLNFDEKEVSYKKVKDRLNSQHNGKKIQILYDKILRKRFFKNLDKYRNCSTHRRHIPIFKITETLPEEYTVTGDISNTIWVLCDDPYKLNPQKSQNRKLQTYCNKMFEDAKKSIIKISENI